MISRLSRYLFIVFPAGLLLILVHNADDVHNSYGLEEETESLEHQDGGSDNNDVKMVIILAGQRTGSSFTGNLLERNTDAFYVYEPLASLYTAMYATSIFKSVPGDIYMHPDGTPRIIPLDERKTVSEFLQNLLTCNFKQIPLEFFLEEAFAMAQPGLGEFKHCIKVNKLNNTCYHYISDICPTRFGTNMTQSDYCKRHLLHLDSEESPEIFQKYHSCLVHLREEVESRCLPIIVDQCKRAEIRAVKLCRGSMVTVLPVMETLPQVKVINLIRDPRSVGLSRATTLVVTSLYSDGDAVKEATMYCNYTLADVRTIKSLSREYQNRILNMIYDEFLLDPNYHALKLFEFVGVERTENEKKHIHSNKNASSTAIKQMTMLGKPNITVINTLCQHFYEEVEFSWPNMNL